MQRTSLGVSLVILSLGTLLCRRGAGSGAAHRWFHPRRGSRGVYPSLPLTERSQQSALPSSVRQHPAVHRLHAIVNNIISWCNDRYSLQKELHHTPPNNLILLVCAEYGLSLPAAMDRVVTMHHAEVQTLLAWEAHCQALDLMDETLLTRYFTGLHHCIRGNLDWSCTTRR